MHASLGLQPALPPSQPYTEYAFQVPRQGFHGTIAPRESIAIRFHSSRISHQREA